MHKLPVCVEVVFNLALRHVQGSRTQRLRERMIYTLTWPWDSRIPEGHSTTVTVRKRDTHFTGSFGYTPSS